MSVKLGILNHSETEMLMLLLYHTVHSYMNPYVERHLSSKCLFQD